MEIFSISADTYKIIIPMSLFSCLSAASVQRDEDTVAHYTKWQKKKNEDFFVVQWFVT